MPTVAVLARHPDDFLGPSWATWHPTGVATCRAASVATGAVTWLAAGCNEGDVTAACTAAVLRAAIGESERCARAAGKFCWIAAYRRRPAGRPSCRHCWSLRQPVADPGLPAGIVVCRSGCNGGIPVPASVAPERAREVPGFEMAASAPAATVPMPPAGGIKGPSAKAATHRPARGAVGRFRGLPIAGFAGRGVLPPVRGVRFSSGELLRSRRLANRRQRSIWRCLRKPEQVAHWRGLVAGAATNSGDGDGHSAAPRGAAAEL